MKNLKNLTLFLALIFTSCSSDDDASDLTNPAAGSINAYFNEIPNWEINVITPKDDSVITTLEMKEGSNEYLCPVVERNLVTTIKNFVSVGTNFGTIWPGAMIQGNSLSTGALKLISTKRAPITLTTNIALNEVSTTIDPNSVEAQQAIADFMIAAGEMPEGSQSGAGTMNFHVEEASTFEQSMQEMSVSAGFTEPQSKVGLDASLSVETSRSRSTHTVVAKYVQEMFTIRVADDLIATPADFFTKDFSMPDLEALENSGTIGADNIPIYIESVTYGRILIFSMESKSVESSSKLSAALEASMADYASVGGGGSGEDEEIFNTATHKIFSAGGTDGAANAAIANLDWSKFFVQSPASTAVPISFVAKTVKGKEIVGLVNSTTFDRRESCALKVPKSYVMTVTWTKTDNTGVCIGGDTFGTCIPSALVKPDRDLLPTALSFANNYQNVFTVLPDDAETGFSITSLSSAAWMLKNQSNSYDVKTLAEGNISLVHILSSFAGSVKFTYQINKRTIY